MLDFTSPLADNISANVVGLFLGMLFRFWSYRTFVFRKHPEDEALDLVGHLAEEAEHDRRPSDRGRPCRVESEARPSKSEREPSRGERELVKKFGLRRRGSSPDLSVRRLGSTFEATVRYSGLSDEFGLILRVRARWRGDGRPPAARRRIRERPARSVVRSTIPGTSPSTSAVGHVTDHPVAPGHAGEPARHVDRRTEDVTEAHHHRPGCQPDVHVGPILVAADLLDDVSGHVDGDLGGVTR